MRHYKNNEFPVRMARIEQMKDKMTDEKVEQEEQLAFLQKNIVEKSIQGIKQQSNKEEAKAIEQATMVSQYHDRYRIASGIHCIYLL